MLKYNVKKDSQFESANQANDELNNYVTYLLSLVIHLLSATNFQSKQINLMISLKQKVTLSNA